MTEQEEEILGDFAEDDQDENYALNHNGEEEEEPTPSELEWHDGLEPTGTPPLSPRHQQKLDEFEGYYRPAPSQVAAVPDLNPAGGNKLNVLMPQSTAAAAAPPSPPSANWIAPNPAYEEFKLNQIINASREAEINTLIDNIARIQLQLQITSNAVTGHKEHRVPCESLDRMMENLQSELFLKQEELSGLLSEQHQQQPIVTLPPSPPPAAAAPARVDAILSELDTHRVRKASSAPIKRPWSSESTVMEQFNTNYMLASELKQRNSSAGSLRPPPPPPSSSSAPPLLSNSLPQRPPAPSKAVSIVDAHQQSASEDGWQRWPSPPPETDPWYDE